MKLNVASMRLRLGTLERYIAELEKGKYLQEDVVPLRQFHDFATRLVIAEEQDTA